MTETVERSVREIDPAVRLALEVRLAKGDDEMRACYDQRLFCLRGGECTVEIGGEAIRPSAGDLILIRSGTPYRFCPEDEGISLIVVNFDFFGGSDGSARGAIPIPPLASFRREAQIESVAFREGILDRGFAHIRGDAPPRELLSLVQEAERGELLCEPSANAYMKLLLLGIFRRLLMPTAEKGARHREIFAYLAEHYAEPLDNRTVAKRFHYHPNYIGELIRAATGMPLHRYLLRLRLRRAAELLASSALPIAEIARQTGFPNAAYFTSYFRRTMGVTPSEFRS